MKEIMNSRRNFVQQTIRASIVFTFVPAFLHQDRQQLLPGPSVSLLPWQDARVMWNLGDRTDSSHRNSSLMINGEGVQAGVALQGKEKDESHLRGGDARAALFNGKGWFSLEPAENTPGFFAEDPMTICIRMNALEGGGLIQTNLFTLVLHGSGLLILVAQVEDNEGRMYREIPLSFISFNVWHDLVFRYNNGQLDFIVDGALLNTVKIDGTPAAITYGPALLGSWKIKDAPLQSFPKAVVAKLFQRIFTGRIDHAAIWDRPLSDMEIALICGTKSITAQLPVNGAQHCLEAYREFHNASRLKNIDHCARLGLSMRKFMARDKTRPSYHLTAPMDGILDPAGAFYHKGQYHVFSYRNMVSLLACTPLAHFVSDDLIHWRDMPIAVWADNDLDVYGIWLANLFYDDKGIPNMLYTALGKEGKIGVLASSNDDLVSFTGKQAVMTGMVHHDGHTWKDGDQWYSLTTRQYWGERDGDLGDAIILLSSPDLIHWTEKGELFSARKNNAPVSDQQRWGFTEFPYLIPFGDRHALIIGTRPVRYWIGRFDKQAATFEPDEKEAKLLDYLNPFHCFNPSITDNKGPGGSLRRIILAMNLYTSGNVESVPWYGVHVLPRTITRNGTRLVQEPVQESQQLRGKSYHKKNLRIKDRAEGFLSDIKGDSLEIIAVFNPGTAKRFGIKVRIPEDKKSGTSIFFDSATGQFGAEGNLKIPTPYPELGKGPSYIPAGKAVRMHLFIDRSLMEVFVNGHTCSGIFNGDPSATGIDLFSEGGQARLTSLDIWEIKPVWTS